MATVDEETKRIVREMLLEHWGKDDPITSREINDVIEVDNVGSFPTTRKIVRNRLFEDGLPVASSNNGYYLIETQEELEGELESINGRVTKMLQRRREVALAAQSEHDDIDLSELDLV